MPFYRLIATQLASSCLTAYTCIMVMRTPPCYCLLHDHSVHLRLISLPAGDALQLERVSSQVIILDPPEKLVLETRASGGYRRIRWMRNGSPASFVTRTDPFFTRVPEEFASFFEIFVREPTTARDLGVYRVNLQSTAGQTQAEEIVFYVTPYSK